MIRPALIAFGLAALPAAADIPDDVAVARILQGWQQADGTHVAGIHITLAPGWKTYWRAPGDAGIPPIFDWSGSRNVAAAEPLWPVPDVFWQNGMRSVGYSEEVVLPLVVTPAVAGDPVALSGRMDIGVCYDVCVPVSIDLGQVSVDGTGALRAALADMPIPAADAGVGRVVCSAEPISDGMRITAQVAMPRLGADEVAVIEAPGPGIWVSEAEASRDGGTLTAVADFVPPSAKPFAVDRSGIRITVIAEGRAVDIRGCTGS